MYMEIVKGQRITEIADFPYRSFSKDIKDYPNILTKL